MVSYPAIQQLQWLIIADTVIVCANEDGKVLLFHVSFLVLFHDRAGIGSEESAVLRPKHVSFPSAAPGSPGTRGAQTNRNDLRKRHVKLHCGRDDHVAGETQRWGLGSEEERSSWWACGKMDGSFSSIPFYFPIQSDTYLLSTYYAAVVG